MHTNKKIKEVGPFGRLFHYVTQFEDCGETYVVYKHYRKRKRYWEYETQHIEIWQRRQSFAKEEQKRYAEHKRVRIKTGTWNGKDGY